jgi:hypothetical protein
MRRQFLLIAWFLAATPCIGQMPATYTANAQKADAFFKEKKYRKAAKHYSRAFAAFGDKGRASDRWNAAICYAMINQRDSAFKNLFRLAEKTEVLDCSKIETFNEFNGLKKDKRWSDLKILLCGANHGLYMLFEKIRYSDQNDRHLIDSIGRNFGFQSDQMKALWKRINETDSINLWRIDSVYALYGWPSAKLAGKNAGSTFWLVIQHSPLSVQEKYLPVMREAVNLGDARADNLAYLEDRVLMGKGLPQKYGSQFRRKENGETCLYKLMDKQNVNNFRKEVGLFPLDQSLLDSEQCE